MGVLMESSNLMKEYIPGEKPRILVTAAANPPPKKKWIKNYLEAEPQPQQLQQQSPAVAIAPFIASPRNGLTLPLQPQLQQQLQQQPAAATAVTAANAATALLSRALPTFTQQPQTQEAPIQPRIDVNGLTTQTVLVTAANGNGNGNGNSPSNGLGARGAGTREVHNKLEKNRRAHLKECFELLKRQLPSQPDDKKTSNLSILGNAIRYIQILRRKERESEHEIERLAREKIAAQQRLASLRRQAAARRPIPPNAAERQLPLNPERRTQIQLLPLNQDVADVDYGERANAASVITGLSDKILELNRTELAPASYGSNPPIANKLQVYNPPGLRPLNHQRTVNIQSVENQMTVKTGTTTYKPTVPPSILNLSVGTQVTSEASLPEQHPLSALTVASVPHLQSGPSGALSVSTVTHLHVPGGVVLGGVQLLPSTLRLLHAPHLPSIDLHTDGVANLQRRNGTKITENGHRASPTRVTGVSGEGLVVGGLTPLMVSQSGAHFIAAPPHINGKMVGAQYLPATLVKPVVVVSSSSGNANL